LNASPEPDHEIERVTTRRCGWRCVLRRTLRSLLAVFGGYATFVVVGLAPVNNDFQSANDGVDIYVSSTAVHSDILVPISQGEISWRNEIPDESFAKRQSLATHYAIGWGDRGFYLNTRNWSDLTIGTAVRAMLAPSPTVMHVAATSPWRYDKPLHVVRLTTEQYEQLALAMQASFARDDQGRLIPIPGKAYKDNDAFFVAKGSYHAFKTCNSWVGSQLQTAGVRTPWYTPLPRTVFLYWRGEVLEPEN
ncbi:MAG: TIGR02117 family protein, partial [Planctomycetales bacterium]|nr:TIGR02117 family protein [Planctomycetales bacterium]